jgi:hypothetical protein
MAQIDDDVQSILKISNDSKLNFEELKKNIQELKGNKTINDHFSGIEQKIIKSISFYNCQIYFFITLLVALPILVIYCFPIFNGISQNYLLLCLTMLFLSWFVIARTIVKLNLQKKSQTNKYMALVSFKDLLQIIENKDSTLNYEYRASVKSILDSLNKFLDND